MKQVLTIRDIDELMHYDQVSIALELQCEVDELASKINIGNLTEIIRKYHQLIIYTVNDDWCIQLFDHDVAANDDVECNYENSRSELIEVLYISLGWVYDHLRNKGN
ncbi:hypothetical protein SMD22_00325 (plasmid) [Brevibacillus halotolerans]|nr:hypothetical protein SMD22_00325 [Brevibacillus halotolerans]